MGKNFGAKKRSRKQKNKQKNNHQPKTTNKNNNNNESLNNLEPNENNAIVLYDPSIREKTPNHDNLPYFKNYRKSGYKRYNYYSGSDSEDYSDDDEDVFDFFNFLIMLKAMSDIRSHMRFHEQKHEGPRRGGYSRRGRRY